MLTDPEPSPAPSEPDCDVVLRIAIARCLRDPDYALRAEVRRARVRRRAAALRALRPPA